MTQEAIDTFVYYAERFFNVFLLDPTAAVTMRSLSLSRYLPRAR